MLAFHAAEPHADPRIELLEGPTTGRAVGGDLRFLRAQREPELPFQHFPFHAPAGARYSGSAAALEEEAAKAAFS